MNFTYTSTKLIFIETYMLTEKDNNKMQYHKNFLPNHRIGYNILVILLL